MATRLISAAAGLHRPVTDAIRNVVMAVDELAR
jgi:hypothetical protein